MRTRAEQIAAIKADQQFWRDLAAEVGPDRYAEPGPMGEWSFGDMAGHLLGWRDRTTGGVALHYLDGTHTDFMRPPHVAVLARELDIALRKVHAELDLEAARAAVDHPPAPVSRSFSMPPE